MDKQITNEDKILAGAAYAFGFPALYILLSEKRRNEFLYLHGAQAMMLWVGIVIAWMIMRILLVFIWNIIYIPFLDNLVSLVGFAMWLYALYFANKAFHTEIFDMPCVTNIIKRIVR